MIAHILGALVRRVFRMDLDALRASADETVAALEAGEIEGWGFERQG